jgi:hypothetical protein
MEIYTRKEISENAFQVLDSDGNTLKNHNGKPYPTLSTNISSNLIGDLNDICKKYYKTNEDTEIRDENLFNNVLAKLSGEELRESFAYCLLSSLIEYEEQKMDIELEFEGQMQWDRLFRLNNSSNTGILELNKTQKARAYFDCKWKNFGLNYSRNLEEMNADQIEFVSDEIIQEIKVIVDSMDISKRVAVNILYNFCEYFSITIPILWVAGKITDEDFVSSYWALQYGTDIAELNQTNFEEPRFLMNRLLYLKTILWGYDWKDQTLPCINYQE